MIRKTLSRLLPALAVATTASPAFAHHIMGGEPMTTFTHGLLSGIGHPILGFDHLFFILLVGIAALYTGKRFAAPAAYIAAMLIGCLMMSLGIGLPAKEIIIALSLLTLGGIVLSGRALGLAPALALFAAFGLFHGSAFGDSIAGQEAGMGTQVLVGYLIGLGVTQYAMAVGAGWAALKLWHATASTAIQPRLAGAMAAGVGVFLVLENAESIAMGLMQ